MSKQKRLMTFLIVLCAVIVNAGPQNKSYRTPAYPQVWHCPDNAIINPMLCDTVTLPTSYTMMIVYQSLQPDITRQLWKLNRTDDKYYSIGTHTMSTDEGTMSLKHKDYHSAPCIYTLQHTIKQDTAYHDIAQLYIGADLCQDTSCIKLYEVAYFNHRLPLYQSVMFQTYLAIKHGITLDGVSYLSTSGDTLWNARESKEFYNHIQGFGTNIAYNYISIQSVSLEDSTICIFTKDTLPVDNYILIGDNNADLSWQQYENNMAILQRIWKISAVGAFENNIQIKINLQELQADCPDTLFLTILNHDYNVIQTITPDSIVDGFHYYTVLPYNDMLFSVGGNFEHHTRGQNFKRNSQKQNKDSELSDYVKIAPNPTEGDFVATIHLAEEKSLTIIIQDVSGKVIHYQILNSIKDFLYKDRLYTSGVYIISFTDDKGNVIATKELMVH